MHTQNLRKDLRAFQHAASPCIKTCRAPDCALWRPSCARCWPHRFCSSVDSRQRLRPHPRVEWCQRTHTRVPRQRRKRRLRHRHPRRHRRRPHRRRRQPHRRSSPKHRRRGTLRSPVSMAKATILLGRRRSTSVRAPSRVAPARPNAASSHRRASTRWPRRRHRSRADATWWC